MLVNSLPFSLTIILGLPRLDDPIQLTSNPKARERCIGDEAQAFPIAIVYDRQHPEPAAIGELIRHEVQRPAIIGRHWDQHRCTCAVIRDFVTYSTDVRVVERCTLNDC